MALEPGLIGHVDHVVGSDDLATSLGSGTVDVLASPRVLAWVESACMAAIEGHLEPGTTTVGTRAQLDHLKPSVVGATVRSTATLERVEGRRLTFAVSAIDGADEVAVGHLTRVIVDSTRFMDRAAAQPTTSQ